MSKNIPNGLKHQANKKHILKGEGGGGANPNCEQIHIFVTFFLTFPLSYTIQRAEKKICFMYLYILQIM